VLIGVGLGVVRGSGGIAMAVIGVIPLLTGLSGFCLLYLPFGIDTRGQQKREGYGLIRRQLGQEIDYCSLSATLGICMSSSQRTPAACSRSAERCRGERVVMDRVSAAEMAAWRLVKRAQRVWPWVNSPSPAREAPRSGPDALGRAPMDERRARICGTMV